MRDPDLPLDLFSTCHACGATVTDPELAPARGMAKGGGFTSMKIFCSGDCADGAEVMATLILPEADEYGDDPWDDDEDDEDDLEDDDLDDEDDDA